MRRVIWSARGRTLFDRDVVGYLLDKGEAGQRALDHIDRAIELLARRPIGRPGRMTGTYEKSVTGQPYIIAYSFLPRDDGGEDDLFVLRIVHTARDWPAGRWPR